jgi:hypothetical protein
LSGFAIRIGLRLVESVTLKGRRLFIADGKQLLDGDARPAEGGERGW